MEGSHVRASSTSSSPRQDRRRFIAGNPPQQSVNQGGTYAHGVDSTAGPVLRTTLKRSNSTIDGPNDRPAPRAARSSPPQSPDPQHGGSPQGYHGNDIFGFAVTSNDNYGSGDGPRLGRSYPHMQFDGISSSAAYTSPPNYGSGTTSSRLLQKRFPPGTMYADKEPHRSTSSTHHEWKSSKEEPTPSSSTAIGNKPYVPHAKPKGLSRVRIPLAPLNGHAPRRIDENGIKEHRTTSIPDLLGNLGYRYFVPAYRILASKLQRLLGRRKKPLSPRLGSFETRREGDGRKHLKQASLVCIILFIVLFFISMNRRYNRGAPLDSDRDASLADVTESSWTSIPQRKWWILERHRENIAQSPPKSQKKATSFARPYHTLDELRALPSLYNRLVPNADDQTADPQGKTPSTTLIFNCIDSAGVDALNIDISEFIAHVLARTPQAISARIIVSASQHEQLHALLSNGYAGRIDAFPWPATHETSFTVFDNISTNHTLLSECPDLSNTFGEAPNFSRALGDLLHVAGTEPYSGKALATAGLKLMRSGQSSRQANVYVPSTAALEEEEEALADASLNIRFLKESRPVDIPLQSVFMQTKWLQDLKDGAMRTLSPHAGAEYGKGILANVGTSLVRQLGLEIWAIPVIFSGFRGNLQQQTVSLGDNVNAEKTGAFQEKFITTAHGSSARIAFRLAAMSEDTLDAWAELVCACAEKSIYEHQVRVYGVRDSSDGFDFTAKCPSILLVGDEAIDRWDPDICIEVSEPATTTPEAATGERQCTVIRIPGADVSISRWIATLPLESLQNWHVPKIDLSVITNNRPGSLHRLLSSLRAAHYLGDRVNMQLNLEQTTDDRTRELLQGSVWPFGYLTIRNRIVVGGLMASIVESWYPSENDTYGVLLEDDVEVSPLFYSWLKYTILYYRYGTQAMREAGRNLYGISLYQPKNIELRPEGRRKFDAHQLFDDMGIPPTSPYLAQVPCSWGAVYFPEHWREFHSFLSIRLSETVLDLSEAIIPDIRSNRWPNSWKRYLIELVYLRGYSMLYPNYAGFRSLSTNHLELGTHVKDDVIAQKRKDLFEVPLLTDDDDLMDELPSHRLPAWSGLPIVDFWGSIVTEKEILARGSTTAEELGLCLSTTQEPDQDKPLSELSEKETMSSLGLRSDYDASKLLCAGEMDEQDWREWRMRVQVQRAPTDIDVAMLTEREERLREREEQLAQLERQLNERMSSLK